MRAGDAVSFDGDLHHAGHSFAVRHRRIHMYLDPLHIKSSQRKAPTTLVSRDDDAKVTLADVCAKEKMKIDVVVDEVEES